MYSLCDSSLTCIWLQFILSVHTILSIRTILSVRTILSSFTILTALTILCTCSKYMKLLQSQKKEI